MTDDNIILFNADKAPDFTNRQKMESYYWMKNKALFGTEEEKLHCSIMCSEISRLKEIEDDQSGS